MPSYIYIYFPLFFSIQTCNLFSTLIKTLQYKLKAFLQINTTENFSVLSTVLSDIQTETEFNSIKI